MRTRSSRVATARPTRQPRRRPASARRLARRGPRHTRIRPVRQFPATLGVPRRGSRRKHQAPLSTPRHRADHPAPFQSSRRASTPDKFAGANASGLILGAPTLSLSKSMAGREIRPERQPGFGVAVRKSTPDFVSAICQKTATPSRFGPFSEILVPAQLSDWKQQSESDRLGAQFATSTRLSYPVRADYLKHLI